jgi:hypothetical protein
VVFLVNGGNLPHAGKDEKAGGPNPEKEEGCSSFIMRKIDEHNSSDGR